LRVLIVFLLIFGLIAVLPPLSLIIFPSLFRGASVWESISKGLGIGFKNWGSTFGVLFIVGLMSVVVSYLLELPPQFWMLFHPGQTGVVLYLLTILSSLASVFVTPFLFVFLAFQYFSITEKEEGISLQNKVDEFDNL